MAKVSSVEPSSTTMHSHSRCDCPSTLSRVADRNGSALYAGTMIEISGMTRVIFSPGAAAAYRGTEQRDEAAARSQLELADPLPGARRVQAAGGVGPVEERGW